MAKREIGTRLTLDGEAEYKSAINNINQQLKVFSSEMVATTSAIDKNNVSISDLRAKGEIYNKQLEAQRQKLEVFNKAVEEARKAQEKAAAEVEKLTEKHGENSEEVQKAERKLAAATATLNDYQIKANYAVRSINQLETAQRSNNDAIAQMENSFADAKEAVEKYDDALDDAGKSAIDFGDLLKANILGDLISGAFEKAMDNSSKELLVMAERVGFTAEAYQEWDYIAKQAGTTMDTLQGGITDLAEKMDDAATGTGEAAEIFAQLGLSVTDTTGNLKNQEQMFEEVVLALQNVEDASKRQALATKLMSTTGEELLPLLNGQIGSVEELKKKAHELGAVLSDTALNDMAALENSLDELEISGTNAATALMSKVAPALTKLADFATENTDVVLALVAAYVSFTGANAIGNGILTLVNSVKQLKTANDAATASQTAMNAAANANPYVLLASAIAAVAVVAGTYVAQLDAAIKSEKELKDEADKIIATSQTEANVAEHKAQRYRELYEVYKQTSEATSELKMLAEDLQELAPDTIDLIDEETGAYLALNDSINDVIQSIRLKGIEEAKQNTLQGHYDNMSEYYTKQAEINQKFYDKIAGLNIDVEEMAKEDHGIYKKYFDGTAELYTDEWQDFYAYQTALTEKNEALEKYEKKLADEEAAIEQVNQAYGELYEAQVKSAEQDEKSSGSGTTAVYETFAEAKAKSIQQIAQNEKEQSEQELADYEEMLANKLTELDENLALRRMSEEGYYDELKKYLDENANTESKAYFEALSKYENYIAKKDTATKTSNTTSAKSTQNTYDTQLSTAKKYFDEIYQLYKDGEIERKEYEQRVTELCSTYTAQRTELTEYAFSKDKELLKSSLEDITDEYESTLSGIQSKINSFKSNISNSFTSMLTFETKGGGALLPSVDEIRKRAQELEMTYSEYLNSDKYKSDINSAYWGRSDEYIDKAYATNKIKSATSELESYLALIDQLRERGISDGLISQLQNMSIEEGMATAKYFSSLTQNQLKALEANWEKYNETTQKLADELYSNEVDAATDAYLAQIEEKLSAYSPEMQEAGLEIVKSLVLGFSDAEQAEMVMQQLDTMFGKTKSESEVGGYDAGQLFALKFASGIEDNTQVISSSVKKAWNEAMSELGDLSYVLSAWDINPKVSSVQDGGSQSNQNVTNINFNQTNTSPQALDAAAIYRGTQQGLQLARVMR